MSGSCIFCDIIEGKVTTEFVRSDEDLVAFKDINPQAPVHLLIVPRKHVSTINTLEPEDGPLIGKMVLAARELAREFGVAESGYRLVFNVEKGGGQLVFHIHMHLLGGW